MQIDPSESEPVELADFMQVNTRSYGNTELLFFELKHSTRVRSEDLVALRLFRDDYPTAKRHLLHLGNEEYSEGEIEVRPLETTLLRLLEVVS
ncbi:MAG: hypothetical protein EBZ48_09240 [Proteobacteria bacterium]|nr:hypothetical protein [Pseudomonadota bacterium]